MVVEKARCCMTWDDFIEAGKDSRKHYIDLFFVFSLVLLYLFSILDSHDKEIRWRMDTTNDENWMLAKDIQHLLHTIG